MKEFGVFVILLIATLVGNNFGFIGYDLTTFFVFILILGLLIYRDRKNVLFDKIIFIRRTKKGRNFIDRTAQKHKKFWHAWGMAGIVVCVLILILGTVYLASMSYSVVTEKQGGLKLLLPGPVSAPTNLPGVFVMPWWIWVIGIAVVIVPHEFMHGIMCRLDKVRIQSVGWILLVIIPGAFVEPDEKQLERAKRGTKLRVYAAGSFANIMTAMALLVIMFIYFSASFTPSGAFVGTINGTPAFAANVSGSLTEIDGMPVHSYQDLKPILVAHNPGDTIQIKTLGNTIVVPSFQAGIDFFSPKAAVIVNKSDVRTFTVVLTANEQGKAYLGIFYDTRYAPSAYAFNGNDLGTYSFISMLLFWAFVFAFGIGIFNMLPMKPLDGGLLLEGLVGKKRKNIVTVVSIVMFLIIVFNLLGPVLIK